MFQLNDDLSIYATRGDIVFFSVGANNEDGVPHHFQPGDIVRMAIYGRKDAATCVMQKDFPVAENCERVEIFLSEEDTKIGETISKHTDYWYEVVLNPDTNPQTIIGYDEDGAKVFRLFPEAEEIDDNYEPKEEDFPVVDSELDMTSPRPVANQAIAKAVAQILDTCESTKDAVSELHVTPQMFGAIGDGKADDTLAIQSALDYAIDTNTDLHIPNKKYRVTATLTLKDTVNMSGDGQSTQNTNKSTLLFDVGDEDIPLLKEAEGVTQVGRCTFTNVSFVRVRTTADGRDENELCFGKSGVCIGFKSNETSFHRCTFVGFGAVCEDVHITDFIDCDIVYCDSILSNTSLCNSVNFYGGNFYACGTLLKANGHLSTVNFTNCWIEDFVTLLETKGVSILGLNFTGCTLTNTVNGQDMIVYTDTPTFAREFIHFTDCLLYIKGQICSHQPNGMEFGLTFERSTVYYGGTGETVKIYGNSKFLTLDGANSSVLATNSGFDAARCKSFSPIQFSNASLENDRQIGKPNNFVETKDKNGNRMLMLPVYYEFVADPQFIRYFVFNTQAVSEGDWVLKFIYHADTGTIEKTIVAI